MKKVKELLIKFFLAHPIAFVATVAGGLGIVNVLDSLISALGITWVLIPDWLRPLFTLIRMLWHPIADFIALILPFSISDAFKDYMLMGFIVAGMRFRSSNVIWQALKQSTKNTSKNSLNSYTQKTIFKPIVLLPGQELKYYLVFLPVRLIFAFVAWPIKIFGALFRYVSGEWRKGFEEDALQEIRQEQYLTFFKAVIWAAFWLLICLIIRPQ